MPHRRDVRKDRLAMAPSRVVDVSVDVSQPGVFDGGRVLKKVFDPAQGRLRAVVVG